MQSVSGTPPVTRCMSGSSLAVNRVTQTSMGANWTSTGQGTHEFQTKRMLAHSYCTSSGRLFPAESAPSFVHAQNFPMDWTDLAWQGTHLPNVKRTRNACGQRRTDWKFCSPSDVCVNAIPECVTDPILCNFITMFWNVMKMLQICGNPSFVSFFFPATAQKIILLT